MSKAVKKSRMPSWLQRVLPYIGVVVGVTVLASPVIVDLVETWRANGTISQATTLVEQIPADQKELLLQQACSYNELLASHETNKDVWPYEEQLMWSGSDVMCWVEIPRIDVRLSVHHGTGDAALASGAGHLDSSSLPVGGPSTHCVISAHSGMPTARMFDDIHDLVPGDVFVLWTLDEPFAYRVTGSEIVEPANVSGISIVPGEDLCTLVTCTPYGVNSQRLLVRGERCPYDDARKEVAPPMYVSPRAWPLVAGLVATGAALCITSAMVVRSRRGRKAGDR